MDAEPDGDLRRLAAGLLADAASFYDWSDDETWFQGYNPVLTAWNSGLFGSLEMPCSGQAVADSHGSGQAGLKRSFRLPAELPAIRLPPAADLAASARSAPMTVMLADFAKWLSRSGRPVTPGRVLYGDDAASAVTWLRIRGRHLPYLWEHALVTGWFELADGPDGPRRWVVPGETTYRWADAGTRDTLAIWAAVFASVLSRALEVTADHAPEAARLLNFQGQGLALAVILFLAGQTGVTKDDASDIVKDGAIGDEPTVRAKRAWNTWVRRHGDPADRLLGELRALRALTLGADDRMTLSPLAQWALREQFTREGIDVPVIPVSGNFSGNPWAPLSG